MTISPEWKQMIVDAASVDAVHDDVLDVLLPPYNRPHYPAVGRVLRTPFLEKWSGRHAELAECAAELSPAIVAAALAGGGHDHIPFAGQSVGLVRDVLPAVQIVQDTMREAARILATLHTSTSGTAAPPALDRRRSAPIPVRPAR